MVIKKSKTIQIIAFLAVLFLVNGSSQYFYSRFDFTKDKRYTLNQKTKNVLENTEKEIVITVFLDGDLPSSFKRLKNATKDLLNDYKAYSKANVKIIFENPIEDIPASAQDTVINSLYSIGIEPTTLNIKTESGFSQKVVFPMAMIVCDGKQIPVKLLQNQDMLVSEEENINNSIRNLEYTFTSSIKKLLNGYNPRIGFTEGNGELADIYLQDAMRGLDTYQVGRVNLDLIDKAGLDKLKVLVIAKPQKAFTEAQKYKLNYFVMRGGRVVWCIDQVSASLDSLKGRKEQMIFNNDLNLDDMLFTYGVRINYDVIADLNCAEIPLSVGNIGQSSQLQMVPWLYYPILQVDTLHNLVKNIDPIRSEFVSTIDVLKSPKSVTKTILLKTSPYNKAFDTPRMLSLDIVSQQPQVETFVSTAKATGVLLEGKFKSVFLNRPIPEGINEEFETPSESITNKMIVISDGDVFKNQVSSKDGSVFPLGFDRYTQRSFGNKALIRNLADYLTDDDNLISLRNKELKARLLDRVKLRLEKKYWQIINVCLPIFMLLLFSIFQHYYRKHKYTK